MQPRQWLSRRLEAMRTSASRGATLVEYALVFSLLVVVALGAVELLNDSATAEIGNQADCVSMRPPPPECQLAAVPPAPPTSDDPGPGDDDPPHIPPPLPDLISWSGEWDPAETTILLETEVGQIIQAEVPVGEPLPGAVVQVEFRLVDPAHVGGAPYTIIETFEDNCTTDFEGKCQISFFVPYDDVTRIWIEYKLINTPVGAIEEMPPVFSLVR